MENRFNAICGQEKDQKFLVEIITQICDYAVVNDMSSTDTVTTIANNLLMIAKIANLDNWKKGENENG